MSLIGKETPREGEGHLGLRITIHQPTTPGLWHLAGIGVEADPVPGRTHVLMHEVTAAVMPLAGMILVAVTALAMGEALVGMILAMAVVSPATRGFAEKIPVIAAVWGKAPGEAIHVIPVVAGTPGMMHKMAAIEKAAVTMVAMVAMVAAAKVAEGTLVTEDDLGPNFSMMMMSVTR